MGMNEEKELPPSFLEKMKGMLGEEYQAYLDSFEEDRVFGLRVNAGKLQPEEFSRLSGLRLCRVPWADNGFYYEAGERPAKDPYYYAGLYYLQEPSAMAPAALLPVEPGDRVLDLCAAPGGKSTELGARLGGEGLLVANDISSSRAKALLKNIELWGISNSCVTSEEPERLASVFDEFFDKILVDAPCSGEGMFRKDKDLIKSYRRQGPEYYVPVQRKILSAAGRMLRPGGLLLYSTCTFSRLEDEAAVEYLMASEEGGWEIVSLPLFDGAADGIGLSGCLRMFPHRIKGEGHFMALLRKKERSGSTENAEGRSRSQSEWQQEPSRRSQSEQQQEPPRRSQSERQQEPPRRLRAGVGMADAAHGTEKLPEELFEFLRHISRRLDPARIMVKNQSVYYLPESFDRRWNLRFLRTGLHLGDLERGRFEPGQALAMALTGREFDRTVSWKRSDERVIRYLKGETVSLADGEEEVKGWCLVCVDGYPLGFAKGNGRMLKNKYYAGWRWM